MFQNTDSYEHLLSKRFKFQVEIRKQQREKQITERRAILIQNKDLELLSQFALDYFKCGNLEETKNYLVKIYKNATINQQSSAIFQNLLQISLSCDQQFMEMILAILQRMAMIESLNPDLMQCVLRFEISSLTREFVVLLNKVVQNHSLTQLIETCDLVTYLVDISLHLQDFEEWFQIIELLCNYEEKPSHYFKKLIIPAFKIVEYDSNYSIVQLLECMCSCKFDHKNAIEYLLLIPGCVKYLLLCLSKENTHAINPISMIIEASDSGAIELLKYDFLQIISNLYYSMQESRSYFIYQVANLCFIKNQNVIETVLKSEIFHTILALDSSELSLFDCRNIAHMLRQLVKRYSNESIYMHLLLKTDLVFMLGHLLSRQDDQEVQIRTLHIILHMAYSASEEFLRQFRQKIYLKPIEYQLSQVVSQDPTITTRIFDFLNLYK